MKHNYFYSLLAGMLLVSATVSAQYTEPAADVMFTPVSITNGNMEANPASIVLFDATAPLWKQWRYGLTGWYNVTYQANPQTWWDITTSGIETNSANVQEGSQSYRFVVDKTARNGQTASTNDWDVAIVKDRVYATTTGTYFFSMYAKSNINSTLGAALNTRNAANKDLMGGSTLSSGWTTYTSTPNWQKMVWSVVAPSGVEALEWKCQLSYNSATHYWDNASLLLRNDNTLTNFYESFNNNDYAPVIIPNNTTRQQIFPENKVLKVTNTAPVVSSTSGWEYYLLLQNLKLKPVSTDKLVLRFRVKLENNAVTNGNLYSWDQTAKNYKSHITGNEGKVGFECKIYKNTQDFNNQINVKSPTITATDDGKWQLVSVTFDASALTNLGASDFISRITIALGVPEMHYKGVMYIDDIRFGFLPTLTNSAITATTVESGNGSFTITPSRDCDLYAVPAGTALNKTALDATVTAGTGFKFTGLTGGQVSTLTAPNNMNNVGGTIDYLLVSYRSEEDYSTNGTDILSVSKGTATGLNKIHSDVFARYNAITENIEVNNTSTINTVQIHSMNGKLIYATKANQHAVTINAAKFPKGIYIVTIVVENNKSVQTKISK